jgi:hypothetical protein
VLALVNAHHQDIDSLGALPAWQWLPRFVGHAAGLTMFYGEIGQHVGSGNELPHLVEDEQACRTSDHQEEYDQAHREELLGHAARMLYPLCTAPHCHPPDKSTAVNRRCYNDQPL